MNSENLEKLIIDMEVGELSPDVRELVSVFAEEDSGAVRSRASLQQIVADLRKSLDEPATEIGDLPSPTFLKRLDRRAFPWRGMVKPLAIAAMIVIAFGLGRGFSIPGPTSAEEEFVESTRTHQSEPSTFWSFSQLEKNKDQSASYRARIVEWSSPLNLPTIGDRS